MNDNNENLNDQLTPVENTNPPVEKITDEVVNAEVKEEPIVKEVENLDVNVTDNSPLVSEVVLPDTVSSTNPAVTPLPNEAVVPTVEEMPQNNEMVTNSNEGEVAKEEPTVVEPVKTDDVVAPVEAKEKSQTKVNIVIIAALVVLLFVVAFVFIIPSITGKKTESDNKDNGKETVTDNSKKDDSSSVAIKDFNGVYEYNKAVIVLYSLNDDEVFVDVNTGSYYYSSVLDYKKGILNDNDLTVKLKDENTISIESNNESISDGDYKKTKEYTEDDFIKDNYSDAYKYLDSKYNGQYQLGDATMSLLQIDEETVRVLIQKGEGFDKSTSDLEYDIVAENKLREEFFDEEFEITIENGTAKFVTVKGDKDFDGTYKKVKSLTKEEIIDIFRY